MKMLLIILVLSGCSTFHVGKNCNYAYREVNGELEKTEHSVCEDPCGPSYVPIIATINDYTSVDINRSVLVAKRENGIYDNIGASNSGSLEVAITDRPSEVRSRTKVEKQIFNTALTGTPTVLHTVTSGTTLYVTSYITSSLNVANTVGEWRIRDGSTDKVSLLTSEKATGAAAPLAASSPSLPEPIAFTTNVSAYEISGDIFLSFYILGYEEAN